MRTALEPEFDTLPPGDEAFLRLQALARLPAAEAEAPLRSWLAQAEPLPAWHRAYAQVALAQAVYVKSADEALALGQAALPQMLLLGSRSGQAQALRVIGLAWRERGELAQCLAALEQALEIERALGNTEALARTLAHLSAPLERVGRREAALQCLEEALLLLPEDALRLRCVLQNNFAAALASRARSEREDGLPPAQWRPVAERAAAIARQMLAQPGPLLRASLQNPLYPRGCLAKALVVLDELDEALPLLAELQQAYAAAGDNYALLYVQLELARAHLQGGQAAQARTQAQAAIQLAEQRRFEHFLEDLWLVLSRAEEALGEHRAALRAFQAFHRLRLHTAMQYAEERARTLAVRLDTARAQRESRRDPLTGLLNRRGFDETLGAALLVAGPEQPLALLLIDLDHFKGVNDRDGHARGDQALILLAQVLLRSCRAQDSAARLGGDEFALLGAMDAETAQQVAERLRRALGIESLGQRPDRPALTLSVGIASTRQPMAAETLLGRADAALYAAKAAGRDAVRGA